MFEDLDSETLAIRPAVMLRRQAAEGIGTQHVAPVTEDHPKPRDLEIGPATPKNMMARAHAMQTFAEGAAGHAGAAVQELAHGHVGAAFQHAGAMAAGGAAAGAGATLTRPPPLA